MSPAEVERRRFARHANDPFHPCNGTTEVELLQRAIAVAFAFLSLTACTTVTLTEPLRAGTLDDLSADQLGFRPGNTTFVEARERMRVRGMTGLAEDSLASDDGHTIAALSADYQSRVFVFRDGRFDGPIALSTHGLPPYGIALRVAANRDERTLLVLYRDPLARAGEPPVLVAYRDSGDEKTGFEPYARTTLGSIVDRQGGMTRPLFVGNDLGDGIMLVARNDAGDLWDTSYVVRVSAGQLQLEPHAMSDALRCSCVARYAGGAR